MPGTTDQDTALARLLFAARNEETNIVQLHDMYLLVETDEGDVDTTMQVVRDAMMQAASVLRVP